MISAERPEQTMQAGLARGTVQSTEYIDVTRRVSHRDGLNLNKVGPTFRVPMPSGRRPQEYPVQSNIATRERGAASHPVTSPPHGPLATCMVATYTYVRLQIVNDL